MLHLSPYLFFAGSCRDALTFYHGCLGGELSLQRYGDSPAAAHLPAEAQGHIMHGTLTTAGFTIMAADACRPGGTLTAGNNVRMSLHFDSEAEIEATFAKLSASGHIIDPLADMFWGGRFGTLTDQFGISWLLNLQRPVGA
jgi:PhnB protein